ncbi:MAG: hypothetical protein JXR95_13105 [Deltaproteobacteria bacterium]|nr:hypothetical protein [Deltaproteobacteria bacterium]
MKPLPLALLIIAAFTAIVLIDNYPRISGKNEKASTVKINNPKKIIEVSSLPIHSQPLYQRK